MSFQNNHITLNRIVNSCLDRKNSSLSPPVVLCHVPQGGVDPTLGRHRVRPRREEFGDARCLKAGFSASHGSAEPGTACPDDHCIILVVNFRLPRRCVCGNHHPNPFEQNPTHAKKGANISMLLFVGRDIEYRQDCFAIVHKKPENREIFL